MTQRTHAPAAPAHRASRRTPGYAATVHALAAAQKRAAPGAPAYSLFVNRRAGRYLAAACHLLGMTPNAVSAVSAAFTFSGILILALAAPSWLSAAGICFCLVLGYAFDSADGQVARLRGGSSLAGEWLDHFLDSIKLSCLHLAVALWAFRLDGGPEQAWLLVPLGFTVVANVSFFAMILNDQLKTGHALRAGQAAAVRTGNLRRSLVLIPTDYGFLCLLFLLTALPEVFVPVYTAVFILNFLHLALAAPKWFLDMTRLEARS
ncbi:CDP-alcohol phosphatidyltransferase family protein [Arthrobacter sp. zg-Y40]|uniref:CDP-alcohol phosphatidyltransferase family protein n=1 Tax=Arthrobacter sp. zg-Y40 TaxID=2886939 RepID=UPI001D14125E|nr:CDP-alcohol phosphatidyltransferase family protein [Arthrobacter sp. zg-Y40]